MNPLTVYTLWKMHKSISVETYKHRWPQYYHHTGWLYKSKRGQIDLIGFLTPDEFGNLYEISDIDGKGLITDWDDGLEGIERFKTANAAKHRINEVLKIE